MFDASIVIPTYNRSQLLELSLASLLKQDLRDFTFETIIIDDGSTDDTKEVVEKYQKVLSIKYIYQEHIGNSPSKSRNKGILAATGNTVIFIDSGVIAGKDLVYEHCIANKTYGECAVIGTVYALYTPTEDPYFNLLFDITDIERSLHYFRINETYHDVRYPIYECFQYDLSRTPAPWHFFWTCNVSVPRRVLGGTVMFDESYGCWGMEDVDLGLRVFKAGTPFVLSKQAEVIHVPHSTAAEFSAKNESNQRNTLLFHNTHNCIESEMCLCGNELNLNLYMQILFDAKRFDFNQIKVPGILRFLDPNSTLVIGGNNEGILKMLPNAHMVEFANEKYDSLRTMMPTENLYHNLGAFTSIKERYRCVFITDIWQHLNEKWLIAMINEAARLGETVYILHEVIIHNKKELAVEEHTLNALTQCILKSGKSYSLQKVNEYNVKLSVVQVFPA